MRWVWSLLRFLWQSALVVVEGVLWFGHVTREALTISEDVKKARLTLRGGTFSCPAGHEIPTEGTFECRSCGFTYSGSMWLCANPECEAPTTPYCNCPVCGLSVRSPHRFGR